MITEEYVDFKHFIICMLISCCGFKAVMYTNSSVQRGGCVYKMTLGATFALYYIRDVFIFSFICVKTVHS